MKQIITLLLLLSSSLIMAQKKQLFLSSTQGVYVPEYDMKGVGYSLGYQHQLKGVLYFEADGSFGMANNTIERGYMQNGFYLKDLNYTFSTYNLDLGVAIKIPLLPRVTCDLMVQPSFLYKTTVYDINNYKKGGPREDIWYFDDDDINYSSYFSDAQIAGKLGARLHYSFSEKWALMCEFKSQVMTEYDFNFRTAGVGVSYTW